MITRRRLVVAFLLLLTGFAQGQDVSKEVVGQLLLKTEKCDESSEEAYRAIVKLGVGALPILEQLGRDAKDRDWMWASHAMARFGEAALTCVKRLLGEREARLREMGIMVVYSGKIREGSPLMLSAYKTESDADLRETMFNACFDPLFWENPEPKLDEVHFEFIRWVLVESNYHELDYALEYAAMLGMPEARQGALRALGLPDPERRQAAISALRKVGTVEDHDVLRLVAVKDTSLDVRNRALYVLACREDKWARQQLIEMLRSGDRERADTGCRYLGYLGSEEWVGQIEGALRSARVTPGVAYEALAGCCPVAIRTYPGGGLKTQVEAWLAARMDETLQDRLKRERGLKAVVEEAWAEISSESGMSVAVPFARLVVAGSDACPQLRKALEHEHPRVRIVAAWLLGGWGDRQAVRPLLRLVESDSGKARLGCRKESRGECGEVLRVVEDSMTFDVATEASFAMTGITGHQLVPLWGGGWEPEDVAKKKGAERRTWMARLWREWLKDHPEFLPKADDE